MDYLIKWPVGVYSDHSWQKGQLQNRFILKGWLPLLSKCAMLANSTSLMSCKPFAKSTCKRCPGDVLYMWPHSASLCHASGRDCDGRAPLQAGHGTTAYLMLSHISIWFWRLFIANNTMKFEWYSWLLMLKTLYKRVESKSWTIEGNGLSHSIMQQLTQTDDLCFLPHTPSTICIPPAPKIPHLPHAPNVTNTPTTLTLQPSHHFLSCVLSILWIYAEAHSSFGCKYVP